MASRLLLGITARLSHHPRSEQHYMKDVTSYLLGATCRSLNGSRNSLLTVPTLFSFDSLQFLLIFVYNDITPSIIGKRTLYQTTQKPTNIGMRLAIGSSHN